MCGRDLTKTRIIRSTIMGYLKFNKHYQIARTWGDLMFVSMNPHSSQIVILLQHSIYKKKITHFLSFFQKMIMVIVLELHELL